MLVVVDHTGADITTHANGTVHAETVDGGGHPVHKAAGAETAGYGDPQLGTDGAPRKNVRAVADRVGDLVDDKGIEVIFVVGEVRSRRTCWRLCRTDCGTGRFNSRWAHDTAVTTTKKFSGRSKPCSSSVD